MYKQQERLAANQLVKNMADAVLFINPESATNFGITIPNTVGGGEGHSL
jgi:ABC-type uncharacterized transport system substrate-binding protein